MHNGHDPTAHCMPFGRYRGTPVRDLPDAYLEWLLALDDLREPIRSAVLAEHRRRATTTRDTRRPGALDHEIAERLIAAGYRRLAREMHPDAGGDPARFRALSETRDALLRELTRG